MTSHPEMTFDEIARELGITTAHAKYIYGKALRKCQKKFETRGLTSEDFELGVLSVSATEAEVEVKPVRRGLIRSE